MNSTFLRAAQQGKNGWRSYLLGILILFLAPLTMLFISLIPIGIGLAIFLPSLKGTALKNLIYEPLLGFPIWFFLVIAMFSILCIAVLKLIVERIHHRNFMTLVNAEATPVNWGRVMQGFWVILGLRCLVLSLVYLFKPERYTLSFNASEWFFSTGLAFLLSGFISAFLSLVLYGYLLQGLGKLIRKPVYIIGFFGILSCLLQAASPSPENTSIDLIFSAIRSIFPVWLVLKDDRLELLCGYLTGQYFFSCSIMQAYNAKPPHFSTLFKSAAERLPEGVELLLFTTVSALFYYLCFHVLPKKTSSQST